MVSSSFEVIDCDNQACPGKQEFLNSLRIPHPALLHLQVNCAWEDWTTWGPAARVAALVPDRGQEGSPGRLGKVAQNARDPRLKRLTATISHVKVNAKRDWKSNGIRGVNP